MALRRRVRVKIVREWEFSDFAADVNAALSEIPHDDVISVQCLIRDGGKPFVCIVYHETEIVDPAAETEECYHA